MLQKIYDLHVGTFEALFSSDEQEYLQTLLENVPHYRLGNFNLEELIADRDNLHRKVTSLTPSQKVFLEIYLKN